MGTDQSTYWGVTGREENSPETVQRRDALADAARNEAWDQVFRLLDEGPKWINSPRLGSASGFTPPHQAA